MAKEVYNHTQQPGSHPHLKERMNMKWNKVLALALSGVLSLGLLSACSGGTTSQPSTAPSAAQEDTDPAA